MKLYLTIALRNLVQAKRRTLLLGSAVALVTFIHIGLQSVSNGYMEGLVRGATAVAAGHINVVGLFKHNISRMYPLLNDSDKVKAIITETIGDDLDSMVDRNSIMGRMIGEHRSVYLFLQGINLNAEKNLRSVLRPATRAKKDGSTETLGSLDTLDKPYHIILFETQAKKLGVGIGDVISFRAKTAVGTNVTSLTVGAIVEDVGMVSQFFTFTSRPVVQELMQIDKHVGTRVLVYLKDRDQADAAMTKIRSALEAANFKLTEYQSSSLFRRWPNLERQDWLGQRLDLTTWQDDISEAEIVVDSIRGVSYVLLLILSVIIIIGIMNTVWISVRERTNEIGCLRAIGMGSRGILLLFMLEAMLLGLIGAIIGGVAGALTVQVVAALEIPIHNEAMRIILFANQVNLEISLFEIGRAIFIFSTVTSLAALLPSIKAAHIQPLQAINHIE